MNTVIFNLLFDKETKKIQISTRDINYLYKNLESIEIFIQKKFTEKVINHIYDLIHKEYLLTIDCYTCVPITYADFLNKKQLIQHYINENNLGKGIGNSERKDVEDAFRLELIHKISTSDLLGFKTGMFLLKNLANSQKYSKLFYIATNIGPVIKSNISLYGYGLFMSNESILPLSRKEEIFNEVAQYFNENTADNINYSLSISQLNMIFDLMLDPDLANNRCYQANNIYIY